MAKKKKPAGGGDGGGWKKRRPAGHPRVKERAVGLAERLEIARLAIRHVPNTRIAEQLGISESTVRYHLENHIKPAWREAAGRTVTEELARIDLIERLCWEKFDESATEQTKERIRKELVDKTGKDGTAEKLVEKVLETWRTPGDRGWLELIKWCVEMRCRLHGDFAAQREFDTETGIRVAGLDRERIRSQFADVVAERLLEKKRLAGNGKK